jgi:hypothetical protein
VIVASDGQTVVVAALVTLFVVLGVLIALRVRRLTLGRSNPLERSRTLATALSSSEAAKVFLSAMSEMGVVLSTDPALAGDSSVLEGKKGMTLRSAGQYLRVSLAESGETGSCWNVSSWPTLQTTVLDWGESRRVVEQFVGLAEKADPTLRVVAEPLANEGR